MNYLESKPEEKNNSKEITKKEIFSLPKSIGATHFCTCCGSPLEKGDVFCSECGIKIEDENLVTENCEIVEQNPIRISSDRMASILETNKIKKGEGVEEFRKNSLIEKLDDSNSKNFSLCGYYVRKDSNMTQYLIIDSVEGNQIKAQIKTIFTNGGYSTEFYEGSFSDNEIHLSIENSDLHPPASEIRVDKGIINTVHYEIQLSENFDGVISENLISGSFKGQFSKTVEFRKC